MSTYLYALAGRCIALLSTVAIIYLSSRYFSKDQQGFFYALTSIAAAQVVFELGFSTVVLQFIGHEKQRLLRATAVPPGVEGVQPLTRLIEIRQLADRWFRWAGLLCLIAMSALVAVLFRDESDPLWLLSAFLTAAIVSLNLCFAGRWAVYEGYGFVREVLFARFIAALISLGLILLLFATGFGVLSAAAATLATTLAYLVCIAWPGREFWQTLSATRPVAGGTGVEIRSSLLRLQSRTAMSFVCGYFCFQSITLIAYSAGSPSLAATIGIAMTIMMATISLATILVQMQMQRIFRLISEQRLDAYFEFGHRLMVRCLLAVAALGLLGLLLLESLQLLGQQWLLDRLPPPAIFVLFMATATINQLISVQATLLRSFKTEPYIGHSVTVAITVSILAWMVAPFNDPYWFAAAYFLANLLIALPYATVIFRTHRRKHLGGLAVVPA